MADDAGAGTAEAPAGEGGQQADGSAEDVSAQEALAAAVAEGDDSGEDATAAAAELAKAQAEAKKWKDFARKHEARVKELSPAAQKLAEIEDAQKSESQKLADRLAAADQRAVKAEAAMFRSQAITANGLPPSLTQHLAGTTEDEINASAETIAGEISARVAEQVAAAKEAFAAGANGAQNGSQNGSQNGQRGSQRPVESMRAGAAPAGSAPQTGSEWIRGQLTR